jgi:nitrate reductase gamma subunit
MMETWLEWAKGPIFQFAFLFMVLGLARHVILAVFGIVKALRAASDKRIPFKTVLKATAGWLIPVKKVKCNPLFSAVSMVMHVGLIVVPVFLFSHVALWERSIGLSLPALPLGISDFLTLITIAAIFALLAMRIISRDGRALSRFEDYAILILLAVPFISGYLALHPQLNPFSYTATMLVHVLSANLLFILMPLTKLAHAVLMPGTQLAAEVAWHFPADSGRKVAVALQKEEEPI